MEGVAALGPADHSHRDRAGPAGGACSVGRDAGVSGGRGAAGGGHGAVYAGHGPGHDPHRRARGRGHDPQQKAVGGAFVLLSGGRDRNRVGAGSAGAGASGARRSGPDADSVGGAGRGRFSGAGASAHIAAHPHGVAAAGMLCAGISAGAVCAGSVPGRGLRRGRRDHRPHDGALHPVAGRGRERHPQRPQCRKRQLRPGGAKLGRTHSGGDVAGPRLPAGRRGLWGGCGSCERGGHVGTVPPVRPCAAGVSGRSRHRPCAHRSVLCGKPTDDSARPDGRCCASRRGFSTRMWGWRCF